MTYKTKFSLFIAVLLWASAFVGIRFGLNDYSPEGLALLRYIIASFCMGIIYYSRPQHPNAKLSLGNKIALLFVGAIGIGFYNIMLNYGELSIRSGMASFIISQSPVLTAIFAVFFLKEEFTFNRLLGFIISIVGIILISLGEKVGFQWNTGLIYILLATLAATSYTILQKPFLNKYNAIPATTYVIFGGTLFLLAYFPTLREEMLAASFSSTLLVIYLGIFPAAIGYIAWSYALTEIPASRAVSFLYFTPFVATLLGWLCLGETPVLLSLFGGVLAILGVWFVNKTY